MSTRSPRNPLQIPEIIALVIDHVCLVPDLLSCACVNSKWHGPALARLYEGSLYDMQFRTPDIPALNCLYTASLQTFDHNLGCIKHFTLVPEGTTSGNPDEPQRVTGLDTFRPMRRPRAAADLSRVLNKCKSLTIPYGTQFSHSPPQYLDALLSHSVEYLAIDDSYCRPSGLEPLELPRSRFTNLKALTIYKAGDSAFISDVCSLIDKCDLLFFHFEDSSTDNALNTKETAKLLRCLARQKNLTTLALNIPDISRPFGKVMKKENPWPSLKALYLGTRDATIERTPWFTTLPNMSELEMLSLPSIDPVPLLANFQDPEMKGRLRYLHIQLDEDSDLAALLAFLPGCNRLEKLSFGGEAFWELDDPPLASFFQRLPPLPRLKYIVSSWLCDVDTGSLRHLPPKCPNLKGMDLADVQLCLSLSSLRSIPSFTRLEAMSLCLLEFDDPDQYKQPENVETLAVEWRRVFPKVRVAPRPGEDFEYGEELWHALGYTQDKNLSARIDYLPQAEREIQLLGWPVLPLNVFSDPDFYTTSKNPY